MAKRRMRRNYTNTKGEIKSIISDIQYEMDGIDEKIQRHAKEIQHLMGIRNKLAEDQDDLRKQLRYM